MDFTQLSSATLTARFAYARTPLIAHSRQISRSSPILRAPIIPATTSTSPLLELIGYFRGSASAPATITSLLLLVTWSPATMRLLAGSTRCSVDAVIAAGSFSRRLTQLPHHCHRPGGANTRS